MLLHLASALPATDERMTRLLTPAALEAIVAMTPAEWLAAEPAFATPADHRRTYVKFLVDRLEHSGLFLREAIDARQRLV